MATQTANNMFFYNQIFFNKTLEQWVEIVHKELSEKSGWKYYPLQKGSFGFDNIIMSIGFVFNNIKSFKNVNIQTISHYVHEGWIENYKFWRDYQPFKTNSLYKSPATPLGDERRNKCSETSYDNLPQDEKIKDDIISNIIINLI